MICYGKRDSWVALGPLMDSPGPGCPFIGCLLVKWGGELYLQKAPTGITVIGMESIRSSVSPLLLCMMAVPLQSVIDSAWEELCLE